MARPHKVWKRKGTDWYYAKVAGKRHRLSQNRDEAEQMMFELLAAAKKKEIEEPKVTGVFPTFRKISDLFLDLSKREKKPTTFRMYHMFLQSACDRFGRKRVNDLKVHLVSRWITETGWGQSTSTSARATVLAALNWAIAEGYIDSHPLRKLKRGSHKRRTRIFTAQELDKIRAFVKPNFRDFLRVLELTGARPYSELAKVTAAMVDWTEETITFEEHKNDGKGKTRTIYLVPEAVEILKRLAQYYSSGPLFRNAHGNEWTSHDATRRLHYATDKLKIPRGSLYAIRHKLISDGLEKGLSANVIAELVGNSPISIARHYDHLSKRKSAMKEAARKAVS